MYYFLSPGDAIDYQKQLKQMIKDLTKDKDKTEKELPKMSQVWILFCAVNCFAKWCVELSWGFSISKAKSKDLVTSRSWTLWLKKKKRTNYSILTQADSNLAFYVRKD